MDADRRPKYWIEKTHVKGKPDRESGQYALGTVLWSPQRGKPPKGREKGADIYRFMREVKPGDIVLHLTDDKAFTAVSEVLSSVQDFDGVENTKWGKGPSYLVPLNNTQQIDPPLTRDIFFKPPYDQKLLNLLNRGEKHLFYNKVLTLNEGNYLTPAPVELVLTLNDIYQEQTGRDLPMISINSDENSIDNVSTSIVQPSYTIEDFALESHFDKEEILNWKRTLQRKKQIIIQGPPGTGKTFVAERLARLLISKTTGFSEIIQFHPAYTYEDFMQGYRPVLEEKALHFAPKDGLFVRFCKKATNVSDNSCVLIIDEINRANLSQVFGELMYLLEHRDQEILLSIGDMPFSIPKNVYLIGTMNTADRSIALVDYALRRRFSFIRLQPQYSIIEQTQVAGIPKLESLIKVLKEINRTINDKNYEIGISFFLQDGENLENNLQIIWQSEIEPYLEEFFFNQADIVENFTWNNLIKNELKNWEVE